MARRESKTAGRKPAKGAVATEPEKGPSFEEALAELTEIVEALESGELGLDESLTLFERGMRLSKTCGRRLEEAERRLERLVGDAEGGFRTVTHEAPSEDEEDDGSTGEEEDGEEPASSSSHDLPF